MLGRESFFIISWPMLETVTSLSKYDFQLDLNFSHDPTKKLNI